MVKLILLLLIFRIDPNPKIIDTFDILEVNHTYNEWGGKGLVQVMGIDWHRRETDFHVEWYKVLRNCHIKTEEGEKKWLKKRREIADKIKDWMTRLDFLNSTDYVGEFDKSNEYYPVKNWRSGYWEIKIDNRIIRAKSFSETHTSYDREVEDRKSHPIALRRGLTKTKKQIKAENEAMGYIEELGEDIVGPVLRILR